MSPWTQSVKSLICVVFIASTTFSTSHAQQSSQDRLTQTVMKGGLDAITAERKLLESPSPEKAINRALPSAKGDPKTRLWMTLAKIPANPQELLLAWRHVKRPRAKEKLAMAMGHLPKTESILEKALDDPNSRNSIISLVGRLPFKGLHRRLPNFLGQGSPKTRTLLLSAMASKPFLTTLVVTKMANESLDQLAKTDGWRFLTTIYKQTTSEQQSVIDKLATEQSNHATPFASFALASQLLAQSKNTKSRERAMAIYYARLQSSQPHDIAMRRTIASSFTTSKESLDEEQHQAFLADPDPKVRRSGFLLFVDSFLSSKTATPKLKNGLYDPWPMVQTQAILSLVARCQSQDDLDPLLAAASSIHLRTFPTYISGLLDCHQSSANTLFEWVDTPTFSENQRRTIAKRLISLAPNHATRFRTLFAQWFEQRLDDEMSLALATTFTAALGQDNHKEAKDLLFSAASDPAFPTLVAASVTALSRQCTQKHNTLFRRLSTGYEAIVVKASQAALRKCSNQ